MITKIRHRNAYLKAWRAKKRAAGLCYRCTKPKEPQRIDLATCQACSDDLVGRIRLYRASGIRCTQCMTILGDTQYAKCARCRAKFRATRKANKKKEGRCNRCGGPLAEDEVLSGRHCCRVCSNAKTRHASRKRKKQNEIKNG